MMSLDCYVVSTKYIEIMFYKCRNGITDTHLEVYSINVQFSAHLEADINIDGVIQTLQNHPKSCPFIVEISSASI